jgi:2-polyprenyl-3-methyl-5-hydroxy-6-metoxy-1,4-benzoquinol methylase
MTRLQERAEFWDVHHRAACQGGMPVLVDRHLDRLCDKDVLEIGPGEGRQFNLAFPVARSYAVADISRKALSQPLFLKASRYLLASWKDRLGSRWDVIHAWYVVHHLLPEERPEFFDFLRAHLRRDGAAFFNVPVPENINPGEVKADGMRTTPVGGEIVGEILAAGLDIVTASPFGASSIVFELSSCHD